MLKPLSPSSWASLARKAKCIAGSSSTGGMHISPRTGSPYSSGTWTNADTVSVTLTASDTLSGVASITYSLDGVAAPIVTVDADPNAVGFQVVVDVSKVGTTSVLYFATDVAGNPSAAAEFVVKIDRTPPTATLTLPDYHPDGATGGTYSCTDAGDGLSPVSCVVEGVSVSPDLSGLSGTFTVRIASARLPSRRT